jgi:hypothetical protein
LPASHSSVFLNAGPGKKSNGAGDLISPKDICSTYFKDLVIADCFAVIRMDESQVCYSDIHLLTGAIVVIKRMF